VATGETGSVLAEHLSPYEVPMDFGKEAIPLQVRTLIMSRKYMFA
jgi:hypothetical protein